MTTHWSVKYTLNSNTYHPLQKGTMTSSIENTTKQRMLITKVGLNFDWMDTAYWYEDCNIEVKPGNIVNLPSVPFTIELEAATGTHLCKLGVTYKLLTETGWEVQGKGIS